MTASKPISNQDRQESLLAELALTFKKSSYPELRGIQFEFNEGILTLTGSVPSYYLKQKAQVVARGIAHDACLDNKLVVRPTRIVSHPSISNGARARGRTPVTSNG